jgi:hypothetical protein
MIQISWSRPIKHFGISPLLRPTVLNYSIPVRRVPTVMKMFGIGLSTGSLGFPVDGSVRQCIEYRLIIPGSLKEPIQLQSSQRWKTTIGASPASHPWVTKSLRALRRGEDMFELNELSGKPRDPLRGRKVVDSLNLNPPASVRDMDTTTRTP